MALFLDGAYVDRSDGSARFRWLQAPTRTELTQLAHTIARRVGRFLERQGLLERDVENSYLAGEAVDARPLDRLVGNSIIYRIAVARTQAERKVFALQPSPPAIRPEISRLPWDRWQGALCMRAYPLKPLYGPSWSGCVECGITPKKRFAYVR